MALILDGVNTAGVSPVDATEDRGLLFNLISDVFSRGSVGEHSIDLFLSPVGHLVVTSLVGVLTRVSVVLLNESVLESEVAEAHFVFGNVGVGFAELGDVAEEGALDFGEGASGSSDAGNDD